MTRSLVESLRARRIWDSRGRPTIEAEITLVSGAVGLGAAPAGASRGEHEAIEMRDGGENLGGWDVTRGVAAIHEIVSPVLVGADATDQIGIDAILDELDPTPTRSSIGGNVTVAVSIAALRASASHAGLPLWRYLSSDIGRLPRPEIQIMGGGAHAGQALEVQDFMVIPLSATRMQDALVQVAEVYMQAGAIVNADYGRVGVADEGGHWPVVANAEAALELITEAIERAGLKPGIDIGISLDIAGTEFYRDGYYDLRSEGIRFDTAEWVDRMASWVSAYAIVAIEDPVESRDHASMAQVVDRIGKSALVVGDDYLVTNAGRIERAAEEGTVTAALIKPNQAGTISAARDAFNSAHDAGLATIVSARSGETEDTTVAELAAGWEADLVKVGSIARGERTAKWNQLIRIADTASETDSLAPFPL